MINWAIVGTGFISNTAATAIKNSPNSTLYAICGRHAETVHDFATTHGIRVEYVGLEAALADPRIDAIYIGLPNHLHLDASRKALAAGKAVYCEKSLTTTFRDAQTLIEAAETSGQFFVEGLMYLAHPMYRDLQKWLEDPRIGPVKSITASFSANIKDVVNPQGGGTLYNIGCYPASLVQYVMQICAGEDAFSARRLVAQGSENTDGNISCTGALVQFDCGIHADLHSSDDYGMDHRFEVIGTHGKLRFITNPWLPNAGENIVEITQFCDLTSDKVERIVTRDPLDSFDHQIRMIEAALKAGQTQAKRPSPRLSDSLELMGLLTEWEAAARR